MAFGPRNLSSAETERKAAESFAVFADSTWKLRSMSYLWQKLPRTIAAAGLAPILRIGHAWNIRRV